MNFDSLKRGMLADAMRKVAGTARASEFFGNWDAAAIGVIADAVERGDSDLGKTFLQAMENDRAYKGQDFDSYIAYMAGGAAAP